MTLAADRHQALAGKVAGMEDVVSGLFGGMCLVPGDVVMARPMALLSSHPEQDIVPVVGVERARNLLEPGVMAFQAAGRRFAGEVSAAVGVERARPPFIFPEQTSDGELVQAVPAPAKV